MAFDFPSNPLVGDIFKPIDGAAYYWNGIAWMNKGAAADYVNVAGDVMTGPLVLSGDPTADPMAANKRYVDQTAASGGGNKVDVAGDTMTGPLILSEHPTAASPALQAATKGFVASISLPVGGVEGQALSVNAAGIATWGAPIFGASY